MRFILVSLIAFSLSFASSVTQTDWSAGAGVQGPVAEWGQAFWSTDDGIDYSDEILQLVSVLIAPVKDQLPGSTAGELSIYSIDIDNDGDIDVVGCTESAGLYWWENTDGVGEVWAEHMIYNAMSFKTVYCADVNSDGTNDVLAIGPNCAMWFSNTDGIGVAWNPILIEYVNYGQDIYSSDVDGDGDIDVLGALYELHQIIWWENVDGLGNTWTEHIVDGYWSYKSSVSSADIDGDGDADILGTTTNGRVIWWENSDGLGATWVEHIVESSFTDAVDIQSTDLDGDGDADILVVSNQLDGITWWENIDGSGTSWTEHNITEEFNGASSVYSSDMDGDGDYDVLGGSGGSGIIWWENADGTGTTWTQHVVDAGISNIISVHANDIDGDGQIDVLGASNVICWWKLYGYSLTGFIESSILDLDRLPEWDSISWTSTEPGGTSVGVQLRSSDDWADMGDWSDTLSTSGASITEVLSDSTRYVQYRLILSTDDLNYTPIINDISLTYLEFISFLSPTQSTIWTHGEENLLLTWLYEVSSRMAGDSVSIDLFKNQVFTENITDGNVENTGQFTYNGPVPSYWEPGNDYQLVITDNQGNYGYSDLFEIQPQAGIEEETAEPILLPFSPNPVSGSASASIILPEPAVVTLLVFDTSGRMVRNNTGTQSAGSHRVNFGEFSSGIYFCRMVTEGNTITQMFVVVE